MSDDSSQEEKQNFLRENILDQGYDTGMFVDFLINKKGEGGADVGNWSMSDLHIQMNCKYLYYLIFTVSFDILENLFQ